MNIKLATLISIVVSLAIFRLLPHLPNVSPVAAMALFGGAYFADKRLAFIIPFLALLVTDLVLGLHNTMIFVYAGFALTVAIGALLKSKLTLVNTAFATLFSSLIFFLLTNFGTWFMGGLYPQTTAGLMQAYVAGLPFLQNSLIGNFVFVAVFFGGYEALKQNLVAFQKA